MLATEIVTKGNLIAVDRFVGKASFVPVVLPMCLNLKGNKSIWSNAITSMAFHRVKEKKRKPPGKEEKDPPATTMRIHWKGIMSAPQNQSESAFNGSVFNLITGENIPKHITEGASRDCVAAFLRKPSPVSLAWTHHVKQIFARVRDVGRRAVYIPLEIFDLAFMLEHC